MRTVLLPALSIVLALGALAAALRPPTDNALAQSPAAIALDPPETALTVGEEAEVSVTIEAASGLFGFDIELSFDPEIVEVVDGDPTAEGVQVEPGDFLSDDFVVVNSVDEGGGLIRLALTQVAPSPPADGDGVLLVVRLRGVVAGDPELAVKGVLLARADGTEHPVVVDGQEPPPPGTPVPTPTPTPTPTLPAATESATSPTAPGTQPSATEMAASPASSASPTGESTLSAATPPGTAPADGGNGDDGAPLWPWFLGGAALIGAIAVGIAARRKRGSA